MANPILQILNGNKPNQNSFVIELFNNMLKTNSQFRKFVKDNEEKSIEDIAMEYDIDIEAIKKYM